MNWIKRLFARRRLYGDVSEEIREHLDEKIDELVAGGMSREEATMVARRDFGNVTLLEERSREVWQWPSIENFLMDIRYGLRMLLRNLGFSAVAVLTLALGIGANTAIFSVVNGVLLHSLPYKDADRLVTISETNLPKGVAEMPVSDPDFLVLRDQNRVFDRIAAYGAFKQLGADLVGGREPEYVYGRGVSASLFPLLGVRPMLGRGFLPEEEKASRSHLCMLSYDLWQRQFGSDGSIVGKAIMLTGRSSTVVGVMPSGFQFPAGAEFWGLAVFETTRKYNTNWNSVIAHLKPGATLEQAQAELDTIAQRIEQQYPQSNMGVRFQAMSLLDSMVGKVGPLLLMLFIAVGIVLLIACCNVANLLLARTTARQREIAIRLALGAARGRLVRQLLTENVLLATLGAAWGFFLRHGEFACCQR
jgi:predicted permease